MPNKILKLLEEQPTYTCPKCGNSRLTEFANERQNNNYCWDCGQKLDWKNIERTKEIENESSRIN